MATEEKTATLTHKVRNPQDLDSWLDIWTATVSANFGENNARTNEKIVIKPSDNWQIQADKLTGTVPVTQISNVTSGEGESSSTQKNVSIISPTGNHIAITNEDGSIKEGPVFPSSGGDATKFLNQAGNWITVETDVPFSATIPTNTTNVALAVGKGDNKHTVIIKPQGKLSFEKDNNSPNNEINLSLGPIETTDLDNNFKLPLENIEDLPENSAEVTGMVKYGNAEESPSVWLTTAEQKLNENDQPILDENNNPTYNYTPDWGKIQTDHIANSAVTEDKIADKSVTGDKLSDTAITDKFETKLLGTTISEKEPKEFIDESVFSKTISQDLYFSRQQVWKTPLFELTVKIREDERVVIDISMYSADYEITGYRTRALNTFSLNDQKLFPNIQQIFNIFLSKSIEYGADGTIDHRQATGEIINILGLAIQYPNHEELTELAGEPINFSKSITNILPQEYLLEWDWKHLGIWVEI